MGGVEWGGFTLSHVERDIGAVEEGPRGEEKEDRKESPPPPAHHNPLPQKKKDSDQENHWTQGLKEHTKEKQDEDEDEGWIESRTKRARKRCRQKERKKIIRTGCGCSGMTACCGVSKLGTTEESRKWKEEVASRIERPPGLPAKGPGQSPAKGSGSVGEQERVIQAVEDQWETIPITVDSGAVDTVGPKEVGAQFPITPTRESRLGLGYRAANGSPIKNYGERVLKGQTTGGQ